MGLFARTSQINTYVLHAEFSDSNGSTRQHRTLDHLQDSRSRIQLQMAVCVARKAKNESHSKRVARREPCTRTDANGCDSVEVAPKLISKLCALEREGSNFASLVTREEKTKTDLKDASRGNFRSKQTEGASGAFKLHRVQR
eukprot:6178705-Pleurochrysis_carterae.AAC.1